MKILKDMIYIYDPENITGQKDNKHNVYFVYVLDTKWYSSLCTVSCIITGKIFKCKKKLLYTLRLPINNPLNENIVMRYPKDMPVFTKIDGAAINTLIQFFEDPEFSMEQEDPEFYKQLKKLQIKINYYGDLKQ